MSHKPSFKVGVVQFDVKLGDTAENFRQASAGLAQLGDSGVELAVLPEMWYCGFDYPQLQQHAAAAAEVLNQISQIASRYQMIIAGSLPEAADGAIFNTLYIIDKSGSILGRYQKIHLFTPTSEDKHFKAGETGAICLTDIGSIGPMICYDLRFPELSRNLTLKGAEILIVSAQWPKVRIDHWQALLKARAIENQLFVIGANRCGHDPGLEYGGCSQIIDPQGRALATLEAAPGVITATLNYRDLESFRHSVPCLKERKPSAYDI